MNRATKFFLVEDDDNHARLILRHMGNNRHSSSLERVVDGEQALEILRQRVQSESDLPDVILLDLNLPKLSGHEVLRQVKEDPHLKAIPVIILSTSDSERDKNVSYQFHANSYLVKPIEFDGFQALIESLCSFWSEWNAQHRNNESGPVVSQHPLTRIPG